MTEKFRNIVKKPIDVVNRGRKKIAKKTADTKTKKVLKGSALVGMGLTEFMMRFVKVAALDNKILRKLERKLGEIQVSKDKNGYEKKFQAFVKKNPNLSAIAIWWIMLGMLVGGAGISVSRNLDKEIEIEQDDEAFEYGTYGAYFDKIRVITPFLIADLIAKEGVHVDKNGMHTPYLDSKGIWTIGFGSTLLKDGTRVTKNTHPITTEEAYELARWHLEEGETYFCMYCYDVAFNTFDIDDVGQAFAMGSVIYNAYTKLIENPDNKECKERFARLRDLYKKYGYGVTDQMVQDLFAEYPVTQPTSFGKAWLNGAKLTDVADKLGGFLAGGRGLYWRRWMEAGLLTGDITPQMLLDCPVNGGYEFFRCMGQEKESFFIQDKNGNKHVNKRTYGKFKEWLLNPVNDKGQSLSNWKRIRDYMPPVALEACDGRVCELGSKPSRKQRIHQKKVERDTYILNYSTAYALAVDAYKAGDYESAARQFEVLLDANPQNALLHNDLAATYNKMGRYDDAIHHAKKIVNEIGDKSQYAAAQYNAGFAYEQKGDLQKALANYRLSVANGNRRVQSDVTRVKNNIAARSVVRTAVFNDAAAHVNSKMKKTIGADMVQTGNNRA